MGFKHYFVLFVLLKLSEAAIPSYIQVCKKNDPQINQCLKKSAENLRPKLKDGIPELNVPSLEPLVLGLLKLRSGPKQAKINADITDVKVYGVSAFELVETKYSPKQKKMTSREGNRNPVQIGTILMNPLTHRMSWSQFVLDPSSQVRVEVDKIHIYAKAKLPSLRFEGNYDFDVSLLVLAYKGQGKMSGNFSETYLSADFNGHLTKINGKDCAQFENLKINLQLGKSYMQLDEAGFKDKTLGKGINVVLEENSDLFFNEVGPLLENVLEEKFTKIANSITAAFSYKELFP